MREQLGIVLLMACAAWAAWAAAMCLLAALWLHTAPLYGAVNATLIVAGCLAFASAVLALFASRSGRGAAPVQTVAQVQPVLRAVEMPAPIVSIPVLTQAAVAGFVTGLMRGSPPPREP